MLKFINKSGWFVLFPGYIRQLELKPNNEPAGAGKKYLLRQAGSFARSARPPVSAAPNRGR
jgi:hypothetical protein